MDWTHLSILGSLMGDGEGHDREHWAERAVSMGQLIVAFVATLGGLFLWGLTQENRITKIEERQAMVIARNADQDRQASEMRNEILRKLESIDTRIAELQVLNAIQHGSPTPKMRGNGDGR